VMGTTWGQLSEQLIAQAREKRIPLIGQFELTTRCNLQCKMCFVCQCANDKLSLRKERTAKEWIRLAEEARNAGMLYLLLTGGEVFLRKDFREIYEEISKMGLIIEIYTNATLITLEKAKWLSSIPPSKVEVTLYGSSSDTYSKVCGSPDAFNKTLMGIDALLDEGINVKLRTTIIKDNIKDFDDMEKIAASRGLQLGIVNYISPRRDKKNSSPIDERLMPKDLVKFEAHANGYINLDGTLKIKKQHNKNNTTIAVIEDIKSKVNNQCFRCEASISSFWVTWDGRMTCCSLMDEPSTSPLKGGFSNAWLELGAKCKSIPSCIECNKCDYREFCMTCPARLKNETGQYDKPAVYLCESAKARKQIIDLVVR
jgi:MoaA/NifB/PqqE/SkfB family radical SAM enzyme